MNDKSIQNDYNIINTVIFEITLTYSFLKVIKGSLVFSLLIFLNDEFVETLRQQCVRLWGKYTDEPC